MAHQPLPAVSGALVGVRGEKAGHLGFYGLGEQRSRATPQNLRQSIGKCPWLNELENVSVGHSVSLLQWRSGGVEHSHDTLPYPLMPPTSVNSSSESPLVKIIIESLLCMDA
jgi:hypothetical protein